MTDTLLLLHAFPLDSWMWRQQIDDLAGEALVVAPDLPGFGGTQPAGDVMTMDAAADAALRALEEAGARDAVVCGLSMGGYVALAFWRRHRDRVAGLVLANTKAGADDDAGRDRRAAMAQRLRSEGNQFLLDDPPPLLSDAASADLWESVKADIGRQPPASIAAASLGMAERVDSTGDLPHIDVPTMVIVSDADTLIPASATVPMADRIPGARLRDIQGAGHLSNLEQPERFTALLREQLVACGAGGFVEG
jgi:3-oxoadipate enol-lactonase